MTANVPRARASARYGCKAEGAEPSLTGTAGAMRGRERDARATVDGATKLADPGPIARRQAGYPVARTLCSTRDRGKDRVLVRSLVRSGMPIPGYVVRHFLRRKSYAQSAWFVNRVQCPRRIGGYRDPDRPVATGDMPVEKSERPSQCQGVARAVMLMPGQAARGGGRRGTAVLTLGSGFLPLSASVRTRVISRPE